MTFVKLDHCVSHWTNFLRVGTTFSAHLYVFSGIPQGSVLGPILFLIYCSDLPNCISSSPMSFADDTNISVIPNSNNLLWYDLQSLGSILKILANVQQSPM